LALPEVEASTSYGTPALKVRGRLIARLRTELEELLDRAYRMVAPGNLTKTLDRRGTVRSEPN
jgi:hypothetical protein